MSRKNTILISIGILLLGGIITMIIFFTEPEARQEGATRKTAMLVEVVPVHRDNYRPKVIATGTVQAANDITLSSRVGGEIIKISEHFTPGSTVKKGTVLLQIDPADYKNALQLRKSDLQLAQAAFRVELGRQDVAKKDYELIGADLSPENQALVLREPQLASAKADVAAAEASMHQAELDLQRTTIRAPFDAHIISRNANVGSQVAPGDELGRLVGMEEYWVVANVPVGKVNWLTFGNREDEKTSTVKIVNENIWPSGQYRSGKLFRLVGALNSETRLARVLVSVPNPLATNDTMPPLMIGTFVETQIEAKEINNVVRLDRNYLRRDETVWVMDDGKLSIRNVNVLLEDADYAYISDGLSENDMVVTTNLSTVVEGADLRIENTDTLLDSAEDEVVHK